MSKEELFTQIAEAVVDMDEITTVSLCQESLEAVKASETIEKGLIKGMDKVSELYENEEYFIPEVLMCSEAMTEGLEVLKPHIDGTAIDKPIKVVIGVVEGDTHDIGKNLVRIMLESGGIEVHDLGRDVPLDLFIERAQEVKANLIGMSTLMTTTMDGMAKVIQRLEEKNLRENYKVLIGGGPISQKYADQIGADLYTDNAASAVRKIKEIFLEDVK